MNEQADSASEITKMAFSSWQFNQPLTDERSWSSWDLRRQREGWWGASGSLDWASTQLQPPLELPIPEIKETRVMELLCRSYALYKPYLQTQKS